MLMLVLMLQVLLLVLFVLMLLGLSFGIFKYLWSFYFIINILMIPNALYGHITIGWIFFATNACSN